MTRPRWTNLAIALGLTVALTSSSSARASIGHAPIALAGGARHVAQAEAYDPVNKPGFIKRPAKAKDDKQQRFRLRKGERVLVLYQRGKWYWIKNKQGRQGWVKKRLVRLKPLRKGKRPAKPEPEPEQAPPPPPEPEEELGQPSLDAPAAETSSTNELDATTAEIASTAAPEVPTGAEGKILVMDLIAAGVPDALATQTTALVAQAVADHPGATALAMQDLKDMISLEESQQLAGCQAQASCAAELGSRGAADLVVNGTLGMVGTSLTLTLSLIDAQEVVVLGRVSQVVLNNEQLAQHARQAVAELMGWRGEGERAPAFHMADGVEPSFAVFDLAPSGVEAATATNLTQILSAELKKIEGARVIGRDDIKAMLDLEADKQLLGCADDTSCLAEIGAALGVQYLVAGHVGRIAETYLVSLRLIDPNTVSVVNRITESFVGPEDQLVGAVRFGARDLVGVASSAQGSLALSADQADAEVYVDGVARGALPLEPIAALAPGRHSLRVVKEGFLEYSGDFYVDPGGTTELGISLEERPGAWYQSWIFWTSAAAVAVAGAVGGGVVWALASEANQSYPLSMEVGLPAR